MFGLFKKVVERFSVVYNPVTKKYLTENYEWSDSYEDAYKYIHNQNGACFATSDLYKHKITGEFLLISGFII